VRMNSKVVILGAGLAGLSAAYHLDTDCEIYEKESEVGGLCRSRCINGFIFDQAVHAIYSQDEYATALIKKLLDGNLLSQARRSWIYSKGVLTLYPFQANTFGLPIEVVKECVLGFIAARYSGNERRRSANFEDWIYSTFGKGIAEHFMIPFNRKLWATDLKEMSIRWIGGRIPQPDLEEVLEGALSNQGNGFGLNESFWYPRYGGIEALPKAFLPHVGNINLNQEVSAIYPDEGRIVMADGCSRRYGRLISSLPLPKLMDMIDPVPISIQKASSQLKYNKVYSVNIGVNRASISNAHWIYYPEQEFVFHRISFPMNFSPSMVPEGASSVTAEISASASEEISEHGLVQRVIDDLILARVLEKDDEILVTGLMRLEPAYVIYNHSHNKNVSMIHQFLYDKGIYPCGRFGMWEYYNMDHAILSGKSAAEGVNREFI
jgi:protoporphyrinogen oxidase